MMKKIFPLFLSAFLFSTPFAAVYAYPGSPKEMTSPDYVITTDSVNFAGDYSSSTNYSVQDSVGEIGTGNSSSTDYTMNAGYQQMYSSFISIGSLVPVTLNSISGLPGGTATGTLPISVLTDNPAGYSLTIQATSSPALQTPTGSNFANYSPVSSTSPDYTFTIASTSSAFGFSVQGTDAAAQYYNNGSSCGTGVLNTAFTCWNGFTGSPQIVAQSSGPNSPTSTVTTLDLKAQVGPAKLQDSGTYTATITVTAVTL